MTKLVWLAVIIIAVFGLSQVTGDEPKVCSFVEGEDSLDGLAEWCAAEDVVSLVIDERVDGKAAAFAGRVCDFKFEVLMYRHTSPERPLVTLTCVFTGEVRPLEEGHVR